MVEEIHLLIGYEHYYPAPDNTLRVFCDKERAESVCEDLETVSGNPDYKERYAELREKYPWLPEHRSLVYDVVTHQVHD